MSIESVSRLASLEWLPVVGAVRRNRPYFSRSTPDGSEAGGSG